MCWTLLLALLVGAALGHSTVKQKGRGLPSPGPHARPPPLSASPPEWCVVTHVDPLLPPGVHSLPWVLVSYGFGQSRRHRHPLGHGCVLWSVTALHVPRAPPAHLLLMLPSPWQPPIFLLSPRAHPSQSATASESRRVQPPQTDSPAQQRRWRSGQSAGFGHSCSRTSLCRPSP